MRKNITTISAWLTGSLPLLVLLVIWTAHASAPPRAITPSPAVDATPAPIEENTAVTNAPEATGVTTSEPVPATFENPPAITIAQLDEPRQFALGMIETGNDDHEVGGAGEVSRYQIMPSVWKHYSSSRRYSDPQVSLSVARQHWLTLYDYFKKQTGREPADFDMYVLWNTRFGYYASKGFSPNRLHPVVRDRAQRFVNLVSRGQS